MKEQIILAGFGGQGIMLAGRLLSYSGMLTEKQVCWLPSYGPEMRGGTANCHVTISDKTISSPIISRASSAIVMNKPSFEKFEQYISQNGRIFINSDLIDAKTTRSDIKGYYIPANEIAKEVGNNKTANIVMLGAFIEATKILDKEDVIRAIEDILGKKNSKLLPLNILAFNKGSEYVKELMPN